MAARQQEASKISGLVRELRDPDLPFQAFGGYARAETQELLGRAAAVLEQTTANLQQEIAELTSTLEQAQKRPVDEAPRDALLEQAVGEVMVTAHRAVEAMRRETEEQSNALLADARAQAQTIVEEAERQARLVDGARAQAEDALARAREEAQRVREDAQAKVGALEAEARRVHLVIDEFRYQWWNLISDALKQLELRVPSMDAPDGGAPELHHALRDRLDEAHDERGAEVESELSSRQFEPGP
jgi:cell division septum initiation protein DivIVA